MPEPTNPQVLELLEGVQISLADILRAILEPENAKQITLTLSLADIISGIQPDKDNLPPFKLSQMRQGEYFDDVVEKLAGKE